MITLNGLDRLQRVIQRLPAELRSELSKEFSAATDEVRAGAVKDAPGNEGKLKNSIVTSKRDNGMSQSVTVQVGYGAIMEWGSKRKVRVPGVLQAYAAQFKGVTPGAGTGTLREAIEKWVKRKGIGAQRTKSGKVSKSKSSPANMKRVAYLIARKIYREGVTPHPFFFKHVFRVRAKLEKRILKLIK